ncbi:hypothetical protein EC973_005463 [Apophysomyces ossiformis]|uniref:Pentatricopeptide repeat-containing protein n=1 Tax=Apophysomyces ossiformis TaxID=679940 RepID=A0A8H7BS71_9FUNG|nr:hypothetical protein EC973_005463 [Apophysomyces ossiformis]
MLLHRRGFKTRTQPALSVHATEAARTCREADVCSRRLTEMLPDNGSKPVTTIAKNKHHPRNLGKGCNLEELFDYLSCHNLELGPARVFKSLRTALYSASGYNADTAWKIFSEMKKREVVHLMRSNHYAHLFQMMKYGYNPRTIPRMLQVLEHMRQAQKQKQLVITRHFFSQILYAMARHGDVKGACLLIQEMKRDHIPPDATNYTSLAIAAQNCKRQDEAELAAKLMVAAMKKENAILEQEACAIMVSVLSKSDNMDKAIDFLQVLADSNKLDDTPPNLDDPKKTALPDSLHNEYMYTTLISALGRKGDSKNAKRLFDDMRKRGYRPTIATYTALMEAYGNAGDFREALKLLISHSFKRNNRRLHAALSTSILANAIRHGNLEFAETISNRWLDDMDIKPEDMDARFRTVLIWLKVKKDVDEGRTFVEKLFERNAGYVNHIMINHLVSGYGDLGKPDQVYNSFSLHESMLEDKPTMYSHHQFIDALFKCREIPGALVAFVNMRRQGMPDDVTMAMVIRGLVMNGENEAAWNLFKTLKAGGIEPNLHAYSSMLKIFAKKDKDLQSMIPRELLDAAGIPRASLDPKAPKAALAYKIFRSMTGFQQPNVYTYTTLISCFGKSNIGRAVDIFRQMCADGIAPTAATYAALLQGCAIFRNGHMALLVFRHMRERQVAPNAIVWKYLLRALVRSRVSKEQIEKVKAAATESKT